MDRKDFCAIPIYSTTGQVYYNENSRQLNTINTSAVFTYLIQQVGKKVENYASDLFLDLKTISNAVEATEPDTFILALRKLGVDNSAMFKLRDNSYYSEYRGVYEVVFEVFDNGTCKLSLYELEYMNEYAIKESDNGK